MACSENNIVKHRNNYSEFYITKPFIIQTKLYLLFIYITTIFAHSFIIKKRNLFRKINSLAYGMSNESLNLFQDLTSYDSEIVYHHNYHPLLSIYVANICIELRIS